MAEAPPTTPGRTCDRADALAVVRRLREAGHVAYFAGGCVRDLLLGLEPKDYDVATDAPPDRVRQLFRNTQAVGQAFGVILVRLGRSQVEVATFRSEGKYLDGRRPSEVHFTTAEEDAKRRDFTINGLFLDPLDGDHVIDYVGGQEDIKARRLRAIGDPDERFEEDHLRLLRAVRFAARFGFEVESRTHEAIMRHSERLARISPERVAEELRAMLTAPTRDEAWDLVGNYGLDSTIFRFFERPGDEDEGWLLISSRSQGFFRKVEPGRRIEFGLALAAAVLDWTIYPTRRRLDVRVLLERRVVTRAVNALRQSLKISNEESEQMRGTLEGLGPLLADEPPRVATLKRFLARPTAGLSRSLLEALPGVAERRDWLREQLAELEKSDYAPPPLVTGDDLTAAGYAPGPAFKRVLDGVYDAQLEGRVATKEEAMGLARSLLEATPGPGRG